jgi:hypothetical protein
MYDKAEKAEKFWLGDTFLGIPKPEFLSSYKLILSEHLTTYAKPLMVEMALARRASNSVKVTFEKAIASSNQPEIL